MFLWPSNSRNAKILKIFILTLFVSILSINCYNSPLSSTEKLENLKIEGFGTSYIGETSADIFVLCSSKTNGLMAFSELPLNGLAALLGSDNVRASIREGKEHLFMVNGLKPNTRYYYQVYCKELGEITSGNQSFVTRTNDFLDRINGRRAIWVVGGIGTTFEPIAAIDVFDPVGNVWYENVAQIPTPRAFSQTVYHKGSIFIIGGARKVGSSWVQSRVVERFDTQRNEWQRMADMPTDLQGGIGVSNGEEIFLISGSTTMDMTTGTILNTVYRFNPNVGSNGQWVQYTSNNAIFPRLDMGGCMMNGSLFFSGGRLYSDGNAFATTDVYLPAANTTTTLVEASNNQARHGVASVCYNPKSSDPFPNDSQSFLLAGGSTSSNFNQPVTAITPSSAYDYYRTGISSNVFQSGPALPAAIYYPSLEISYENRRAYLMGGANSINIPTDTIYSIDLANPIAGPWRTESIKMPRPRFAHKAIIINR
ncbi:hypothetical protein EHQ62_16880 [Leptospira jelokensis]|uniref:Galactose oxidase n=1 Tax=Leptospira jelokensis TaxID=2484931 RepID=A0A4Z0ZN90_9LEPT|nr:hypothetical protein EHQ62_16880 [Leptospira jelokensis]